MLVLSRKKNQSVVIPLSDKTLNALREVPESERKIEVLVVEIRGDKTMLGCEAPKCVPVHRSEVFEAIKRETARAREAAAS